MVSVSGDLEISLLGTAVREQPAPQKRRKNQAVKKALKDGHLSGTTQHHKVGFTLHRGGGGICIGSGKLIAHGKNINTVSIGS